MFDLISIGDATIDVFLELDKAQVSSPGKSDYPQICFNFGDKIPVQKIHHIPGTGNASNVAIGTARLGLKTAIASILGNDLTGEHIQAKWKHEQVNTDFVSTDPKHSTNYSTVITYQGERTIFVFHEKRNYIFPKNLTKSKNIYLTSLGLGSEKMSGALLAYVKETGTKLFFQPGTYQLKLPKTELYPLIQASTAIIVNKEEAEIIVGDHDHDIKVLLARLREIGARIAVITDGSAGSYAYDGNNFWFMPIFDVPVVERTGCGDAYATGLVVALHHGAPIHEAMRWGTANSTSVLGFVGPQKGLLDIETMTVMLQKFKTVTATTL